jgi:AraC-like DNA-binding protein
LCAQGAGDRIVSAPAIAGMERIEAWFSGNAYDPHRHDTYAIGVTLEGVQTFRYRGAVRYSLPGQIIVLHPDEVHDGGAATEAGLRYRMLYIEPSLLADSLDGHAGFLPFVKQGVVSDAAFRDVLLAALGQLNEPLEGLFLDDFLTLLADCLSRHSSRRAAPPVRPCLRSAKLARDYLEANALRRVRSEELEAATGLDRFSLSRHFRAAFSTSPHRFQVMRRLQKARRMIEAGDPLAEIASATGFSDQSHFNRHFKKTFGVTPGRWAALVRG